MASSGIPSAATIFFPALPAAAQNLQTATLFTRIHIRATPQIVKDALENTPNLKQSFLLGHHSDVLVFDRVEEEHVTHVRALLQMLRDKDLKADLEKCAFNKKTWAEAGFHIDPVQGRGKVAFMVVLREHLTPDALAMVDGGISTR